MGKLLDPKIRSHHSDISSLKKDTAAGTLGSSVTESMEVHTVGVLKSKAAKVIMMRLLEFPCTIFLHGLKSL